MFTEEIHYYTFYITAPDNQTGRKIAGFLVENRLAACVSVLPSVRSVFWWDNKIDEADECMLIGKTDKSKIHLVKEKVVEVHPYEIPEIIFMPIADGYEPYLKWISESVK